MEPALPLHALGIGGRLAPPMAHSAPELAPLGLGLRGLDTVAVEVILVVQIIVVDDTIDGVATVVQVAGDPGRRGGSEPSGASGSAPATVLTCRLHRLHFAAALGRHVEIFQQRPLLQLFNKSVLVIPHMPSLPLA